MIDVTIIGSGPAIHTCTSVLGDAGFRMRYTFDIEPGDRSPLILGDAHGGFALARQAIESGRHVLIASPATLSPERLSLLMESRKRNQALFVWSERRYHPGYRFVSSLREADHDWRPRYIRHETLSVEPTTSALARWLTLESLCLLNSLTDEAPQNISSRSVTNTARNAPDVITMSVAFEELEAFVQVGLGEAVERRETLLAGTDRKAYVDELNQSMPVRLVESDRGLQRSAPARWLATATPTNDELARQQCLAFFDATLKTQRAQTEAGLWLSSLAAFNAAEKSLVEGKPIAVTEAEAPPRFRVLSGRSMATNPTSVA